VKRKIENVKEQFGFLKGVECYMNISYNPNFTITLKFSDSKLLTLDYKKFYILTKATLCKMEKFDNSIKYHKPEANSLPFLKN